MDRLNILLVEDNNEHLRLTKYILKQNGVEGDLFVVRDGQEAMDYLYRRNKYAGVEGSPRPSLVLLDLNIPRVNGRELLRIMKADRGLKDIPVVVVSSSDRPEDVAFAQEHGATAYISKASGFDALKAALSNLQQYTRPTR
jgi:two-component system response regulator